MNSRRGRCFTLAARRRVVPNTRHGWLCGPGEQPRQGRSREPGPLPVFELKQRRCGLSKEPTHNSVRDKEHKSEGGCMASRTQTTVQPRGSLPRKGLPRDLSHGEGPIRIRLTPARLATGNNFVFRTREATRRDDLPRVMKTSWSRVATRTGPAAWTATHKGEFHPEWARQAGILSMRSRAEHRGPSSSSQRGAPWLDGGKRSLGRSARDGGRNAIASANTARTETGEKDRVVEVEEAPAVRDAPDRAFRAVLQRTVLALVLLACV